MELTFLIRTARRSLATLHAWLVPLHNPNAQDVEEQREALTRKLSGLEEQLNKLQKTLADCQKGAISPSLATDIAPKDTAM
jgi:hypothetical protein